MRLLVAGFLQILFLTACFAEPAEWRPPHEDILGRDGVETRTFSLKNLLWSERGQDLANPGFESVLGGEPAGWNRRIGPELRSEPGNRFVRVNGSSFYEQRIAQPAPHQHVTFSMVARGEIGNERAGLQSVQWIGLNGQAYTTRAAVGMEFSRVFAPIPVLPGFTEMELRVRGASDREWIDADDALLLDEGFDDGSFSKNSTHWELAGDATITTGELHLGASGRASQLAAAMFDGQEYFLAGSAEAIGTESTLQVTEQWLAPTGVLQGEPFTSSLVVGGPAERFLVQTGNQKDVAASRVVFENAGPGGLILDDVSRGSTTVFPPEYDPAIRSENPLLRLIAVWPREIESGVVEIRTFTDELVDSVPLSVDRGVGTTEWSGQGQPGGIHTARFILTNTTGTVVTIDRPFTLHENLPVGENDAYSTDVIGRGVWLWMIPEENLDADRAAAIIASAQEDGFNLGVIWAQEDQWPAIVEACARRQFPFLPANLELNAQLKEPPRVTGFHRAEYIETLEQKIGLALASPWSFGYYLVDEPFTDLDVRRAAAAHAIAAAMPAWKLPFMIIWGPVATEDKWDTIRPVLHMTDFYPWTVDGYDMTEGLQEFSAHVAQQVAIARARNRAYWAWPQVFATPEYWRSPNAGATRALVGITLAHGGTGYVLFAAYQIGGVEGLRTRELAPLPEALVWREENARVEAATEQMLQLTNHREPILPAGPLLITLADDPEGGAVLFAVSLETRRPVNVQFDFSETQSVLSEITGGNALTAIGSQASAVLGPGEWRAWQLPSGTINSATATIEDSVPLFDPPRKVDLTYSNTVIVDIAINPRGDRIALGANQKVLVLDELGGLLAQQAYLQPDRVRFEDNDLLLISDQAFGLSVHNARTQQAQGELLRVTGTAFEALPTPGDTIWLSLSGWGLRRIERAPDGTITSEPAVNANGQSQSLFGPFEDDSVLLFNADHGIFRSTPGGSVSEVLAGQRFWRGDLSPSGHRLAAARNRRGFSIHQFDGSGSLLATRDFRFDFDHVEDVAWVTDQLLAVADSDGDIGFFFVDDTLGAALRHQWLLKEARTAEITAIEANGTDLAVGYRNGRLVVLDLSALTTGWVLQ